jgi:Lrp/AsnC family transcriptional regulator for asnA, asnC and gidA
VADRSANGSSGAPILDDVDHRLIELLAANGRSSNVALARELDITETTVRKRLDRLFSNGLVRVIAVTDPALLGYHVDAVFGLSVVPRHQRAVARRLAEQSNVRYVAHCAGRFNIITEAVFRDPHDLNDFLVNQLGTLDGVSHSEVFYVLGLERVAFASHLPPAEVEPQP